MKKNIGWCITGAGHEIHEIYGFISEVEGVELFMSRAAEEVSKIYKVDPNNFSGKMHTEKSSSSPICGKFASNQYRGLVVAPATSNSVAKFVLGISDTLITNIFAHAGKDRVPTIVYPTDVAPEMQSMGPSKPVMVYPRKVDLAHTNELSTFETVTVVRSIDELRITVLEMFC